MHLPSKVNIQDKSIYVVISGATDGSIAFWDLTGSIEAFMQQVSILNVEKLIDIAKSSSSSAANAATTVEGTSNNSLDCIADITAPVMNTSESCMMSSSEANHTASLKADETT